MPDDPRPTPADGQRRATGGGKDPDEQHRLAEQRLRAEIARQRQAERAQMAAFKWGCVTLLSVLTLVMIAGFLFF